MDPARRKVLDEAQELDRRGKTDAAADLLVKSGQPEEAARLLAGRGRFADAGRILLVSLRIEPRGAAALDAAHKKQALLSAIYLAKGGEAHLAAELFVALGESTRAVEALERAGDKVAAARVRAGGAVSTGGSTASIAVGGHAVTAVIAQKLEAAGDFDRAMDIWLQLKRPGDAARVAASLGRVADAAELYATAGMPIEAAGCYYQLGDSGKCLDNLVRASRSDPRYRWAATQAIHVAAALNYLGFELENFLTQYIAPGPQSPEEMVAFDLLARVYEQHGFPENTRELLAKVIARDPNHGDAAARLQALDRHARGTDAVYDRILREGSNFEGRRGPDGARVAAPPSLPAPPAPTASVFGAPASSSQPVVTAPFPASGEVSRAIDPRIEQIGRNLAGGAASLAPSAAPAAMTTGATLFEVGGASAASRPAAALGPGAAPAPRPAGDGAIAPGSVLANRFRIEERIGRGGMAEVFRATDLEASEQIALKIFAPTLDDDGQMETRIKLELRLSRKLSHVNIIRIYDIGIFDRRRYISMELLRGGDLLRKLGAPVPFREGLGWLIQACAGLAEAHACGVVHRDVKPENLFLTDAGVIKVMDFGLAKGESPTGASRVGMLGGTPEYMAPEQINNFSEVTPATDLYAIGVVAYQMFTGSVPFRHAELMPLLMMHVNEIPPPARSKNPAISEALDSIITRLLAKDPAARFGSARDLSEALSFVLAQTPE